MKIKLKEVSIREIVNEYKNDDVSGAIGYGGLLNIRPKYQREFVYKDKQRDAVMNTVRNDFPLNVMYWACNTDGTFEVLDGQQRTISVCEYVMGGYSINYQYFHNLEKSEQEQILNYKLMIYFCEGEEREKLNWFETINIAGEKLTSQELKNAVYTGEWLTSAKTHFSKPNCAAYNIAKNYIRGSAIRQDYLETAINWISDGNVSTYMSTHQHDHNANELWLYFQSVINWVEVTFTTYRKEIKGVDFGTLYNDYHNQAFDANELEKQIAILMLDDDVTKKSGIYNYVITGNEKHLSVRAFTPNQKRESYESQNGNCPICGHKYELSEMEADHITPWSKGGKTVADNCQMLCKECNRRKSDK